MVKLLFCFQSPFTQTRTHQIKILQRFSKQNLKKINKFKTNDEQTKPNQKQENHNNKLNTTIS